MSFETSHSSSRRSPVDGSLERVANGLVPLVLDQLSERFCPGYSLRCRRWNLDAGLRIDHLL
jgi:hypothetical protein